MGLFIPRENLIRWTEPTDYQKDKSSLNLGFVVISFCIISIIVLIFTSLPQKNTLIGVAVFIGIFVGFINAMSYFGFGMVSAALKEGGVGVQSGKYGSYSDYRDIESCIVTRKKFPSAGFFHLEFTQKEEKTFLIRPAVAPTLLPNSVDLNYVLDILRDKGVKIVENYDK